LNGIAVHPLLLLIREEETSVSQARSERTDFSGFGKTRPKTCNTFPPISITIERGVLSEQTRPFPFSINLCLNELSLIHPKGYPNYVCFYIAFMNPM
jgi:hypothetical protein